MNTKAFGIQKVFMGRFPAGCDLLRTLSDFVSANGIECGFVSGIGALKKACLGVYLQKEKRYERFEFEGDLELLNLTGNISLKEGKPFVHAHLFLSDNTGRSFGGHLLEGTIVFVFEYKIFQLKGESLLDRKLDSVTGLYLWPADSLPWGQNAEE